MLTSALESAMTLMGAEPISISNRKAGYPILQDTQPSMPLKPNLCYLLSLALL